MSQSIPSEPKSKIPGEDEGLLIEGPIGELRREQAEVKKRDQEHKKQQLIFNHRLVWFTFGLLIASFIGNGVAIYQSVIAKRAADAATIGANAAASAAKTADATLKSSQKSFRTDLRPYLVTDIPQFLEPPAANGKTIRANVTFKDIGRTPALNDVNYVNLLRYRATKSTDKFVAFLERSFADLRKKVANQEGAKYGRLARRDVAPTATIFTTAEDTTPLSVQEVPELEKGTLTLFFVGIAKYTDAFDESYETEFCYFYFGTDPRTWHICDSHNIIK